MDRIKIHYLYVISFIILLGSCQSNDEFYLKEFCKQNNLLKEQYENAINFLVMKGSLEKNSIPYSNAFFVQEKQLSRFYKEIDTSNVKNMTMLYKKFIVQFNYQLDTCQKKTETKILKDDYDNLKFKNDSLPSIENPKILKELIKSKLYSKFITYAHTYSTAAGSIICRFSIPDLPKCQLIINRDTLFTFNLKYRGNFRIAPYFKQLQFISLCEELDGGEEKNINNFVIEHNTNDNVLKFKTKPLSKGFYQINCNKIVITEIGKLEKIETYFDFEIE